MLLDQRRLGRRLDGVGKIGDGQQRERALADIADGLSRAEARVAARRAGVPQVTYPGELPISHRCGEIAAAIRDNQVVIVAGETGSGKTTQLPKMCLELGRGVRGQIGHTQPRRIAARTMADRIAAELGTELGAVVGYQVRFSDQSSEATLVKLMTDGILLNEIQSDRLLSRYDTIIVDEAHERSLNVDFILGYLKQLLPRRRDLKIIVTSATIDPERFSQHFSDAPIVEVSGRTYPVELRYRPLTEEPNTEDDESEANVRDQTQAILDAVSELCAEGPGDILVFLSGEREIRDTADALGKLRLSPGQQIEVLPLYARLSTAEQHRVFAPHSGRRVVLATNVAETSLTVPGIHYVVDPGTARISRYSHRTKVQRLPIERISRASADQRKGRCGRVARGVCIRLYSEADFDSRPVFTDPEILRTSLASVILQMTALGLGDMAAFPFLEPPDRRDVKAGVQLLEELGAIDPSQEISQRRLTPTGRQLAQLPTDPRLARMIVEADRNGCLLEVAVIAAALSIQDPRERPLDHQQAADTAHARFKHEGSDFLGLLDLWLYVRDQRKALSSNRFRRLCREEYLNYLRIREWQDLVSQLRQVAKSMNFVWSSSPDDPDRIHQSVLAGLLSHVGTRDAEQRDYLGARNAHFSISPGSALFKTQPQWVMAAELVETTRLWGRMVASIQPEWAEALSSHLVKRTYSEPHWESKPASVMAYERVTLYGLPLVAGRKVSYGRIDPELSRELFIRSALVEGDWRTGHRFFHQNRRLLEEAEDLEHKARRRGIVVDDETLFEFYDERVGAEVVSGRHFDAWWKAIRREQPDLLTFSTAMLVGPAAADVSPHEYPDVWRSESLALPVTYAFEPGSAADGVSVAIPLAALNQVSPGEFDWQVPGLRQELVTALIRSLPKTLRRNFVPAPNYAKAFLARVTAGEEPLLDALERELLRTTGVRVPREAWGLEGLPAHLRATFRVVDDGGELVGVGKDLTELRRRLEPRLAGALSEAASTVEQVGLTDWTFDELPDTFEQTRAGHQVRGYPALVDEGSTVAIRVLGTRAEQRAVTRTGLRRLLMLTVPSPVKSLQADLDNRTKLSLGLSPGVTIETLLVDCFAAAIDSLVEETKEPVRDRASFEAVRERARVDLTRVTAKVVAQASTVLSAAHEVDRRLSGSASLPMLPALADMKAQAAGLVHPGFVAETGLARLPFLPTYLAGISWRLDRLARDLRRDAERMAVVHGIEEAFRGLTAAQPAGRPMSDEVRRIRWMIEELRISFFAQALGTAQPVSEQRVWRAINQVRGLG
jgi:ATP-dependent helicase HrpA